MKLIRLERTFVDEHELAYARLDDTGRYQVFVKHCNGPVAVVSRRAIKGLIVLETRPLELKGDVDRFFRNGNRSAEEARCR